MEITSSFVCDKVYYKLASIEFTEQTSFLRVLAVPFEYSRKYNKIYSRLYVVKKPKYNDADYLLDKWKTSNYLICPKGAGGLIEDMDKVFNTLGKAVMIAEIVEDVEPIENNDMDITRNTNLREFIYLA